jgi:hypothetical protein
MLDTSDARARKKATSRWGTSSGYAISGNKKRQQKGRQPFGRHYAARRMQLAKQIQAAIGKSEKVPTGIGG